MDGRKPEELAVFTFKRVGYPQSPTVTPNWGMRDELEKRSYFPAEQTPGLYPRGLHSLPRRPACPGTPHPQPRSKHVIPGLKQNSVRFRIFLSASISLFFLSPDSIPLGRILQSFLEFLIWPVRSLQPHRATPERATGRQPCSQCPCSQRRITEKKPLMLGQKSLPA